jgi:hypothetical protein
VEREEKVEEIPLRKKEKRIINKLYGLIESMLMWSGSHLL